jgi:diguanylate cyclase (GGDEF)-like protein
VAALEIGGAVSGYTWRMPSRDIAPYLAALKREWTAAAPLRAALFDAAGRDHASLIAQLRVAQAGQLRAAENLTVALTSEVQREQRGALQRMYALLLLDILLLAAAFARVRRRLVAPLRALARQSRALARGNYDVRVDTDAHDEIGELATVFNNTAQRIGRLVADMEADRQQLRYGANYDSLTGLANRNLLTERLREASQAASRKGNLVGVLLHDLDNFKVINDSLGHEAGDTLLKAVAERMRDSVRSIDTVARFGGDEFVVVVPDVDSAEQVMAIARQLLADLSRPFTLDHQEVYVSASIGIALYPRDGEAQATLLKNVDLAMYRAKREGRNTARFFTEQLGALNRERQKLEAALHSALETNQFELHYQPKVDYASGTVTGVEALVRWNHPVMGMIEPAVFIPLAEDIGLIERLGKWVLHTACRQNRALQNLGVAPVVVAVNVSARQLDPEKLVAMVSEALTASGLAPCYLELELTETAIMHDAANAMAILADLKALGVRLSLDDFGTGYSSLDYLRRFPFDSIKIDRSFIHGVGAHENDRAIVRTIIALAGNLNMSVIAEGVEQRDQADFLMQHACHEMQGFLFARAMPASSLERMLASHDDGARMLNAVV